MLLLLPIKMDGSLESEDVISLKDWFKSMDWLC